MGLEKAIAKAIFRSMVGKGMGSNRLIRLAQSQGGSYRRIDMLNDIRKMEDRLKYEKQTLAIPFNEKVPRRLMIETDLKQQAKYRIQGYMTVYDEDTDSYLTQKASFYTDNYSETGDYAEAFTTAYWSKYQEEALEITEFQTRNVEHNKGWDY